MEQQILALTSQVILTFILQVILMLLHHQEHYACTAMRSTEPQGRYVSYTARQIVCTRRQVVEA
jgi:hypothetical protein